MSTTPPEQPDRRHDPPQHDGDDARPVGPAHACPIPGNAEFAMWLVVEIILAIIWIAADSVNTQQWAIYTVGPDRVLHPQPRHREGEPRPGAVALAQLRRLEPQLRAVARLPSGSPA